MGGKRSTSRLSMMARHQPERMQSPAVERVEIEKHRVIRPEVPPGTTGPSMLESRVGALEQQQAIDHTYLEQLAAAVRSRYEAQEWERLRRVEVEDQSVVMDMNIRREMAAQREELQNAHKKIPEMGNEIAFYVDTMEGKIVKLQQIVDHMRGKGAVVENYLEKLDEQRPKEGQAVMELINNEVSRVKELVNKHYFGEGFGAP